MVLWLKQEMLEFGNSSTCIILTLRRAGTGRILIYLILKKSLVILPHDRGTLSMARTSRSQIVQIVSFLFVLKQPAFLDQTIYSLW